MTNKEAIKELKSIRPKGGIIPQKRAEAIDVAIDALEKQIPQKPYEEYDGYSDGNPVVDYFCPTCMEDMDCYNPKHCWKCGQAIDWSDTK